jgi:hypothetical protein
VVRDRQFSLDTREDYFFLAMGVFLASFAFLYFSGLDAQVEYALSSPGQYFSTSNTNESVERVVLTDEAVSGLNFVSKNSIGVDSVGSERGFCSGLRSDGTVYDFRLADGIESSSRQSITFSCVEPRDLVLHSQPSGVSDLSQEDMDFEGELLPDVTCIQFGEVVSSPLNSRVSGVDCWDVVDGGDSFVEIRVFRE